MQCLCGYWYSICMGAGALFVWVLVRYFCEYGCWCSVCVSDSEVFLRVFVLLQCLRGCGCLCYCSVGASAVFARADVGASAVFVLVRMLVLVQSLCGNRCQY